MHQNPRLSSPDPLVGWGGGIPPPISLPIPLSLDAGAYGASLLRPPTQIPGYAYDCIMCWPAYI